VGDAVSGRAPCRSPRPVGSSPPRPSPP
jgi:hypothetical protein